jgi:hypothetical protein
MRNARAQFQIFLMPNQIEPNKNAKRLKDNDKLRVIVYFLKFMDIVIMTCLYKAFNLIRIDIFIFIHLDPQLWIQEGLFG